MDHGKASIVGITLLPKMITFIDNGQFSENRFDRSFEKGKTSEVLNKPKQEFTKELLNCSPKLPKKWF